MTTTHSAPLRFAADEAESFAKNVLRAVGAREDDAAITAENLVFADRSGIASHGLLRLPLYAEAAHRGGINTAAQMTWRQQSPGGGLLDADGAFGQVAMNEAVRYAIDQLHEVASVVVAVHGSVHYGAGAFWVDQLAQHSFLGIATSTTGPVVSPFGGAGKVLGTNPISIGMPAADKHHMTVDMATSNGAYGKVIAARNAGQPVPEGWAVDREGNPTTDAQNALDGSLTPFGGHKGSGFAVALEGISAALSEASYAFETTDIWANPASQMNVGHTLIAFNPAFFTGTDHTRSRISALRDRVRSSGDSVFAPGDIEAANRERSEQHIELAPSTVELLHETAETWQVPPLSEIPLPDTHD